MFESKRAMYKRAKWPSWKTLIKLLPYDKLLKIASPSQMTGFDIYLSFLKNDKG